MSRSSTYLSTLLLLLLQSSAISFVIISSIGQKSQSAPRLSTYITTPSFVPHSVPSFVTSNIRSTHLQSSPSKEETPKRRGRPRKDASTKKEEDHETKPKEPMTPAEALEFADKQWIDTHTFDEDEELNTWDLQGTVHLTEPVERGKLVVVTGPMLENEEREDDKRNLEVIERTVGERFGEVVSVEHRVMGTDGDNLFEVWIEAYEHELLFSRRSAVYDKDWDGGKDVGEVWDSILDTIEDMVSDDAKYSYRV